MTPVDQKTKRDLRSAACLFSGLACSEAGLWPPTRPHVLTSFRVRDIAPQHCDMHIRPDMDPVKSVRNRFSLEKTTGYTRATHGLRRGLRAGYATGYVRTLCGILNINALGALSVL